MTAKLHILLMSAGLMSAVCLQGQGLIIPAGSYVTANNGNIVVSSNWINNGSFTHNGGTVVFAGSTQTLGGSTATTFNNLTTATGSTTTITSAGHLLKNVLLSNGTLNANGNLTLLSTASQTAAVDGSGAGEVMGNLVVQRYIAAGFGYKYFSSPFQNDNVGDFSDDMNLAAAFPSFYRHDENLSTDGWVNYTSAAGTLMPLLGYAANLGGSLTPKTIDLSGVVNNHGLSIPLYNHNRAYTQGFNLIGNPYPSPINWDAAGGWTKTNIDNAVYFFNAGTADQYTGVYSSYINGVSSDGIAGSTIAAMRGFFVHVSNGGFPVTGLLGINNGARILSAAASFFRVGGEDDKPLLRLTARQADLSPLADPLTFYFADNASAVFNKELDALKLLNTDSLIPNLFAVSKDVQKLSINALSAMPDSLRTVPLGLMIKKAGWVSFNVKNMTAMPAAVHVYFLDKTAGVQQELQKDAEYRVLLSAGDYENRFFLQVSSKDPSTAPDKPPVGNSGFTSYSANGRLFVNPQLAGGAKASLAVMNAAGQLIHRQEMTGNSYQEIRSTFSNGVYMLYLSGAAGNQSRKIFIGNR